MSRLVVKVGGAVAGERRRAASSASPRRATRSSSCTAPGRRSPTEMQRRGIAVEFVARPAAHVAAPRSRSCASRWSRSTPTLCAALGDVAVPVLGDDDGLLAVPVPPLGLVGDPLPVPRRSRSLAALADGPGPGRRAARRRAAERERRRRCRPRSRSGSAPSGSSSSPTSPGSTSTARSSTRSTSARRTRLLDAGAFEGGIIPKLRAAALAAASGDHAPRSARRRWSHDARREPRTRCCRPTRGSTSRSSTATARGSIDADGKRYLDLFAGIAVVGLGHRHPAPLAAAHAQLDRLWHVSNLYWTEPMSELADEALGPLRRRAGVLLQLGRRGDRGRAQVGAQGDRPQPGVVALEGSFHGRTLGALSVTGQPAKRAAFEPLVPGARFATPERLDSLEQRRPTTRPRSCSSRCRAKAASIRSTPQFARAGARRSPTSTARCSSSTRCRPGVGRTGSVLRVASSSASGPTP